MRQIVFSGFICITSPYLQKTLWRKFCYSLHFTVKEMEDDLRDQGHTRSHSWQMVESGSQSSCVPLTTTAPLGPFQFPRELGGPSRKPPWKSERFGTSTRRNASWPFKYNTCFNYNPLKRWHPKSRKKVQVSGLQYLQKEANRDKRKTYSCQSNSTLARILI